MTIRIVPNEKGTSPGKLADAELHFDRGPLAGLKLVGFVIWENEWASTSSHHQFLRVTVPSREHESGRERRRYDLLRPISADSAVLELLRKAICDAYTAWRKAQTAPQRTQAPAPRPAPRPSVACTDAPPAAPSPRLSLRVTTDDPFWAETVTMSEPRTRYGTEPLMPQRREAIRHSLQAAIRRLQAAKDHVEKPRPIMYKDCDEMLEQREDANLALAAARELLECVPGRLVAVLHWGEPNRFGVSASQDQEDTMAQRRPRKDPAAVSLGRRGGLKTSPAKTRAARINGRKGGRRPKAPAWRVDNVIPTYLPLRNDTPYAQEEDDRPD
jgi:hypothetical protein